MATPPPNDLALFTRIFEDMREFITQEQAKLGSAIVNEQTKTRAELLTFGNKLDDSARKNFESMLEALGARMDIMKRGLDSVLATASAGSELHHAATLVNEKLDKIDKVMPKADMAAHFKTIQDAVEQLGDAADLKAILTTVEDSLNETRQLCADVKAIEAAKHASSPPPEAAGRVGWQLAACAGLLIGAAIVAVSVRLVPDVAHQLVPPSKGEEWASRIFSQVQGVDCITSAILASQDKQCSVHVTPPKGK